MSSQSGQNLPGGLPTSGGTSSAGNPLARSRSPSPVRSPAQSAARSPSLSPTRFPSQSAIGSPSQYAARSPSQSPARSNYPRGSYLDRNQPLIYIQRTFPKDCYLKMVSTEGFPQRLERVNINREYIVQSNYDEDVFGIFVPHPGALYVLYNVDDEQVTINLKSKVIRKLEDAEIRALNKGDTVGLHNMLTF